MQIFCRFAYFLLSFWKMNIGVSLWWDIVHFLFLLHSCQILFYMYLKGIFLGVYSFFHCDIFFVNCSFINMKCGSFPLVHFHSSCYFIWYHYCFVCLFLLSIFLAQIFSLSFPTFLCVLLSVLSDKQHASGMHYCCFILSEWESLSFNRWI